MTLNCLPFRRAASSPVVHIRRASAEEEATYVDHLLDRLVFYQEHGYIIALPDSPVVDQFARSKSSSERAHLREQLTQMVHGELYSPEDYSVGLRRMNEEADVVRKAIAECRQFENQWGFAILPEYTIILTRYGTGGSYNLREGRIIIRTDVDGGFKRKSPSHTVAHEMVHIGVERCIVERFHLSHIEKERVVDLVCSIGLKGVLREYEVSQRGDTRLDSYVTRETLHDLPSAVADFVRDRDSRLAA